MMRACYSYGSGSRVMRAGVALIVVEQFSWSSGPLSSAAQGLACAADTGQRVGLTSYE